jgi:DNA-binding SARP family transcriptional activator/pimeloyl-ACP methyl ester carboxylesterase
VKVLLRISVLGRLAVLRDGPKLQLPPSKKTRALLAYLAVTERPHSRSRLCAMFWSLPDDPRAALRWSLTRLRAILDGPDDRAIVADREAVELNRDCVTVDILSLRDAARNGVDSLSTESLAATAEALGGDFLEDLELPDCADFQSWCTAEREETRRLRARLLAALIGRLEDAPDEALAHARALSLLEPANEDAQAVFVRLLRATGRHREAEEQLHRAQQRLTEFKTLRTGALRKAAQAPLRGHTLAPEASSAAPVQAAATLPALHDVQFCRTADGVRIAYACVGEGPPLVWATHWLSHISFNWATPIWRHWTEEFARDRSFIHYDHRGHGLSDWEARDVSINAFVRDLEAVVDALGLQQFALIGTSRACPMAISYAARHPDRVSHLVLHGALATGWRAWGDAAEVERREATVTLTRQGWDNPDNPAFRQMVFLLNLPDATAEEVRWLKDLQRFSVSADNAARVQNATGDIDVLDLLPKITAPTLVLHAREDLAAPFEQGRLIASRIPGAQFVALESRNHFLVPRDPAWAVLVSEIRRFLREGAPSEPAPTQPNGPKRDAG